MTTQQPITAPPAGYTLFVDEIHNQKSLWAMVISFNIVFIYVFPISHIVSNIKAFKRDDDGNVVINQDGIDAYVAKHNDPSMVVRIIPDSELPAEGMTIFHTSWNETTRKWELPIIDANVHAYHERNHDSDVAAAETAICNVKIKLMLKEAVLVNLNPDQQAHAKRKLANFDDCIDDIVDANAEPAIERTWLKSFGGIKHTAEYGVEPHFVNRAHDFATAYINLINSKTMGQRRGYKYQYTLCLIDELNADRDRTGSARFLPRGVKLVKTKSTPADAKEVTLASLFTKLRNIISPSEGAPKPAV